MRKRFTKHNYLFGALVLVMVIGIVVMVATAVQDFRARSGMFTTTQQVREYTRNKCGMVSDKVSDK